jgi:hypothetical protein
MTELEKVEKLREKADVSFAEAKEALDNCGGDILDALIYLEKQGKTTVPAGGGYFSGNNAQQTEQYESQSGGTKTRDSGESFGEMMKRFGRFCLNILNKGNNNFLNAYRGDELILSCPVTALVALLIFFFWVTIPVFIISLFCGLRYRFRGADFDRDSVNKVMEGASNVVDDVKKTIAENRNSNNSQNAANESEE